MCDCVETLKPKLAALNTEFVFAYYQGADMKLKATIQIAVKKRDGRGKRPALVQINFCPFCGESWGGEASEKDELKTKLRYALAALESGDPEMRELVLNMEPVSVGEK